MLPSTTPSFAEIRAIAARTLLFLLLSSLVGSPVPADVLVTTEGERIETEGPWEVDGRRVIFTDANGRLSALRVSAVDLEASELATNPPPPPPPTEAPPPPERPLLPRADPDRPKPVLILTDEDIPQAAPDASAPSDGPAGGLLASLQRLLAGGLADPGVDEETKKELDEALGDGGLAGAGETLRLLVEVMSDYPEVTQMTPGDPESIRGNADSIRAAAEDLRKASDEAESEQARSSLRTFAVLMEAKLGDHPG